MSPDGSSVNYSLLAKSDMFQECLSRSRELKGVDVKVLDEDQRKAFFISILENVKVVLHV